MDNNVRNFSKFVEQFNSYPENVFRNGSLCFLACSCCVFSGAVVTLIKEKDKEKKSCVSQLIHMYLHCLVTSSTEFLDRFNGLACF